MIQLYKNITKNSKTSKSWQGLREFCGEYKNVAENIFPRLVFRNQNVVLLLFFLAEKFKTTRVTSEFCGVLRKFCGDIRGCPDLTHNSIFVIKTSKNI